MIRATLVKPQHRWTEAPADTVVLDFDDRHRRRMAMTGTRGLQFLLDLENALALRGGDALVLEDGRLIEVVAAAEPLLEIRGRDPEHLWLSHQLYRAGVLDWAGAKHTIQWSDDVWRIGRGLVKKKRRL